MSEALDRYVAVLDRAGAGTIDDLVACFAEDGRFRDPFSDVRGKAKIRRVFEKTYEDVDDVAFAVTDKATGAHAHYLRWTFTCLPKGFLRRKGVLVIEGLSELHFDAAGLVTAHLDYWDPAPGLYRRVPVLGYALDKLRRQIGVR
jgi:steroid delta-isomerase